MRACVCVISVGCGSDYSDQAVTGSLFLSSTILLLKLVMNIFYSQFHSLLKGQFSVTGKTQFQALLYLLDGSI